MVRVDPWSRYLVRLKRRDKEENAMRLRTNANHNKKNTAKGETKTKEEDTHKMRAVREKETRITAEYEKSNSRA